MTVVDSLFGVPWDGFCADLTYLKKFLDEAGDEGLTWEVKGDAQASQWPRREQIEKAVGGFANSHLGGVLIIGAERPNRKQPGWVLSGLSPPPEEEAELALSRVIRSGVRPTPPFRVKSWQVENGKKVAVIWVAPVDRPPSITRDGRVFERTTGETEPVRDPAILARLFEAGERVSQVAEAKARAAAVRALHVPNLDLRHREGQDWDVASQGRVGLGVAATAYGPDIGDVLFRTKFAEAMEEDARAGMVCVRAVGFNSHDSFWREQRRDRIVARLDPGSGLSHSRRFAIAACWDGSVGVASLQPEGDSLHFVRDEVLGPVWNVACRLALHLGASGQIHMALHGSGPMHYDHRWPSLEASLTRRLDLDGPTDPDAFQVPDGALDYVMDELHREGGEERWIDET